MNIEGEHTYDGILDWISGVDRENIRAGQEAERRLAALNAQKEARTGKPYVTSGKDVPLSVMMTDPKTSVAGGFKEGLAEGATNIRQNVGGAIGTTFATTLSLIPWQVWVAGGIWLYLQANPGALQKLFKK